jgi:hypothetical protein
MKSSLAGHLEAHGSRRARAASSFGELRNYLAEHDLLDASAAAQADSLRQRLATDKFVVAFVAEFSRGKSELINAIFFADAGRRVLPATPGRTTMCPVELAWDAQEPTQLALLPIHTRLEGLSLADLRQQPAAWTRRALDEASPEQLADALTEVTRTRTVSIAEARALGFWNDAHPQDNPRLLADGRVEVPAWRHAVINYPHPLLRRGLVVLDTPGLNAIGAEPELTLGLLPQAHATVFILAADAGVTRSDLEVWRDHLGGAAGGHYVVLNKIDTLADPLASEQQVRAHIDRQVRETAEVLGIDGTRVFPLSAREALAARVIGDEAALQDSRLPMLERALAAQLQGERRELLCAAVRELLDALRGHVVRSLGDRRRQLAEQMLELRGLRGKSSAKVRQMLDRVDRETAEFEACTAQLQAVRSVHARMLKAALNALSSDRLRDELARMQADARATLFALGARKAFQALCQRLRAHLLEARRQGLELREMLAASYQRLNSDYGFGLAVDAGPDLGRFIGELDMIERSYERYLGLSQALRLSEPGFIEQFRRMLLSKLRVVFENAGGELDMWSRNASAQVDAQLRERRRAFRRRREALERIQVAAGELEARLAELKLQDERLHQTESRVVALVEDVWSCADAADAGDDTTPPSDEDADAGAVVSMDAPMPVPRLVAAG